MTTPNRMRAIVITRSGGPEVLEEQDWPLPAPGPGEIRIRVAAAGVNGPDLAQRRGLYDPPPGASPLPGLEVAGEISALGEGVKDWSIGMPVMALCNGGGYAQEVVVPQGQVLPVPKAWSFADAAALPETWFTVTQTLVMRAGVEAGMNVLVHGASGGIGSAAIQIATLLGARAIAVVSSPEKADYARHLGAFATVAADEDIAAKVMEVTANKGADRVVDVIGGAMAAVNVAASAGNGHIVQVSTLGGGTAPVPLRGMMAKGLTLSGSTLRPQDSETKAAIAARIRDTLLPHLQRPDFVWQRVTRFAMAEAGEAHRLMEARGHIGKVVLVTPWGEAEV